MYCYPTPLCAVGVTVQSKAPTIFTIVWPEEKYHKINTVKVEWEMIESVCQFNAISYPRNVGVNITDMLYVITGLEEYSKYDITVCIEIERLLFCHSITDTTNQSGICLLCGI